MGKSARMLMLWENVVMVGKKLSESEQSKERITGTEDNVKETFHADISKSKWWYNF